LFINEDEARMSTGFSDPDRAARVLLDAGVRTAVMKLGDRGCAIFTGALEYRCPAFEVEARDTTGAGDCFVAGFLAATERGASLHEAGCFGNAVGAFAVQNIGAVVGIPQYEGIVEWTRTSHLRLSAQSGA
jgi:sugar/nucleoside kinase (ribokinase family)